MPLLERQKTLELEVKLGAVQLSKSTLVRRLINLKWWWFQSLPHH
jgi:hypothetical protein